MKFSVIELEAEQLSHGTFLIVTLKSELETFFTTAFIENGFVEVSEGLPSRYNKYAHKLELIISNHFYSKNNLQKTLAT